MEYLQYVVLDDGEFVSEFKTPLSLNSEEELKVKNVLLKLSMDTLSAEDYIDDLIDTINSQPNGIQIIGFKCGLNGFLSMDRITILSGGIPTENTEEKIYDVISDNILQVIGENSDSIFENTIDEVLNDVSDLFDDNDILYSEKEFSEVQRDIEELLAFGKMNYTPSIEILRVEALYDFIKQLIKEVKEYNNNEVNRELERHSNDVKNYIELYKVHFSL